MKKLIVLIALLVLFSCENNEESKFFKTYDETELIKNQQDHKISRMKFKLIQSKVLDMNANFKPFNNELATNFSKLFSHVENIDSLIPYCDGLMVARGDLGVCFLTMSLKIITDSLDRRKYGFYQR